jgi:hypothetical protein
VNVELLARFFQGSSNSQAELFAFRHTRSGNQTQPALVRQRFPIVGDSIRHPDFLTAIRLKVNDTAKLETWERRVIHPIRKQELPK